MTTTITGATGIDNIQAATGAVLQVVNFKKGTVVTGTNIIPLDNTVPLAGDGFEVMTLAITPRSSSSTLKVDVVCLARSNNSSQVLTTALYRDGSAAIATTFQYENSANFIKNMVLTHFVSSTSTNETTFKVRVGQNQSGTCTFNDNHYGGTLASTITVTEIAG